MSARKYTVGYNQNTNQISNFSKWKYQNLRDEKYKIRKFFQSTRKNKFVYSK